MNYAMLGYILGRLLEAEAVLLLFPALTGAAYGEWPVVFAYLAISLLCFGLGFVLCLQKPERKQLYTREGFVSVALGWMVMSLFGSLPFVLTGEIPGLVDALFETVSGFTTTGASVLADVESLSRASLFWRSFTHWIGGMGVFVLIMAVLPLMGGSSMNLMRAESTGPSVGKMLPRVKDSAKILYTIYVGITVAEVICLLLCGLGWLDALTLSFGTVGTGGFGIRNDSMASFSVAVQNVVAIFMTASGINYTVFFLLLSGHIKEALSMEELRWYLAVVAVATLAIAYDVRDMFGSFGEAAQQSFFQVASIITSTGYSSTDYNNWTQLSKTILVILMFMGGCAGSTCGGIKVARVLILLKTVKKEMHTLIHPGMIKKIKMDNRVLPREVIRSTNVYIAMYFMVLLGSLLLIGLNEVDFTTGFTAVVATLNNIGPGLEGVGPASNFSLFSDFSKLVLIFNMLAGRLELYPVLVMLVPACWKKY